MVASGGIIYAADVALAGLKTVRRGNRTSTSASGLTTETGYLRVDNIPMVAGRAYLVLAMNFGINLSSTTSGALARLRLATSGTATTGSTEIAAGRLRNGTTGDQPIFMFGNIYVPSSTLAGASILLSGIRASGTDTFQMIAGTGGCTLLVLDAGEDPGDTGVDV